MKHLMFLGALVASISCARAEFYLGGSATTTSSEFDAAVDKIESDEFGWKVYAGYNFMRFIGAEIGYRDLGNFSDGTDSVGIDLDLKVIDGSVRAYVPILPLLNVFAKAGYANIAWDGDINIGEEVESFDEDDWELFYGVGADLNLGRKFAVRAEWEMYDVSDDLNTLSLGIVYRF